MNSTMARLECASQVMAVATRTASNGTFSEPSEASTRCRIWLSRSSADTWLMMVSPSSIRPKPINTRPVPRTSSFSEALNRMTPMKSRPAQIHLMSKA